eukprot:Protomagalhaensia_wolfi_Nauph_80__2991@NODE_3064_length_904_cov_16_154913_g2400_i0_p1_GENE_NODE_3064_length_904_cov_16_154913_g2400_i0NODE_3064_length_904_cov_16_154913_g2400_i0_p1_ORF_typecomplete_len190_score19_77_NODE_3064_length_904_cov_16_154913_g2400_i037606
MQQDPTDEVVGLHVYKPRNKPEVRLVYRYVNPQSKQRKTVRHQKSFSCNRFGEEGAWKRAQQMLAYINATGRLPPASPAARKDERATKETRAATTDWNEERWSYPGGEAPAVQGSAAPSVSTACDEEGSGTPAPPSGGVAPEGPHLGWISIQPHNINDLCAQGLVINANTLVSAGVVGVPLLLPRRCFR